MNLLLKNSLSTGYSSGTQIARRLTEGWVGANMYCPRCGNCRIEPCANNAPVSDFICPSCRNQYELKSKNGSLGKKVPDGAYEAMIRRITSDTNPDFLFLEYDKQKMEVRNFLVVPKRFFVPAVIEKRRPLALTARRAGWTGCNILLSDIPKQGRIDIIIDGKVQTPESVVNMLNHTEVLTQGDLQTRGWLFDVLKCVNAISCEIFTLADMYHFESTLAAAHPDNHNIQAKIRQQLQLLRDAGYVEFLERGTYKRINHE